MKELSDQDIKEFLEQSPLYVWQEFKRPRVNRGSLWIKEIKAYCEKCQQSRPFQDLRPGGSGSGYKIEALTTGNSYFEFSCVSCRKETHFFLVHQVLSEQTIKLMKFGELPRKPLERDTVLQKFFKEDCDNYEKAVVCLANGYGIAAFAYLRRIIENNISKLLDMLQEEAQATDQDSRVINAIGELRKESPISDKIKIANNALPKYLIPHGLNPLGRLYQVLSEGVHTYSDEECLEKSRGVKECIKYLVGELASRKEHRNRFASMVGKL
jgi:hypothetical protein